MVQSETGHKKSISLDYRAQEKLPDSQLRSELSPAIHEVRRFGCSDNWGWSRKHKSPQVRFYGDQNRIINFHPNWSSGTAGVRGSCPLDGRRHYWELNVSRRVYGTAIMFGVATSSARYHADAFINLLGEDCHGWGLSHKGLLWHGGQWSPYTRRFRENEPTTIGLLYDGVAGTLTYYKDGSNLGVAFRNLHSSHNKLYPFVCSSAAQTKMTLVVTRRDFVNLQDRCRHVIAQSVATQARLDRLPLPPQLNDYVSQSLPNTARIFRPASQCKDIPM